jgi:hypothetical protein
VIDPSSNSTSWAAHREPGSNAWAADSTMAGIEAQSNPHERSTNAILADVEQLRGKLDAAEGAGDKMTMKFVRAGIESYTRELTFTFGTSPGQAVSYRALTRCGRRTKQILKDCFVLRGKILSTQEQPEVKRAYIAALESYVRELHDTYVVL